MNYNNMWYSHPDWNDNDLGINKTKINGKSYYTTSDGSIFEFEDDAEIHVLGEIKNDIIKKYSKNIQKIEKDIDSKPISEPQKEFETRGAKRAVFVLTE